MSTMVVVLVGATVMAATWLALYRLHRRRLYQLAFRIPGAPQAPLVGHLHHFMGNTEEIMTSMKKFSYLAIQQNGITKVWLGHLLYFLTVDPADIEFVLKTCLEKDDLHRFLRNFFGNGIIFAPVNIWRRRRKIIVPAFSPKVIESFVEVFSEHSEVLAAQLQGRVGSGVFDAWPFFSSYTLDSVCETVMGIKINAQKKRDGVFLVAMTSILNLVCKRIFHVWQQPDWLYRLMPSYNKHEHCKGVLHSFTDNVINLKREELEIEDSERPESDNNSEYNENRKSFLSRLISQSSKERSYTNVELREEVLSLTVAGTDTSAVGICFTLLLLGMHQDVQEKVYQELLDVYGNSDRPLVKEDLSKMCYLERVIKESLRLYPPVPFIIRKVQKEITLPSGCVLPAGSGVPISIWGVHRNPKYWGADAERFLPDRFAAESCSARHPYAYLPFAAGPRNCLGYQYAMMSMKTSVSRVLRQYRVLVSAESLAEPEIRVKIDIMMKAADGYKIFLEPRHSLNNNCE